LRHCPGGDEERVLKTPIFLCAVLAAAALAVGVTYGPSLLAPQHAQAQDAGSPAKAKDGEAPSAKSGGEQKKKRKRRRRNTLVKVDKVRMEPLRQTMPVIGRIVSVRAGVVASRIDAPVAEVKVDVGHQVKKGDIIATLVNDRFKWDRAEKAAEVNQANAKISTAKARLALARQELQRISDLKTSAAYSKARFQDKQLEVTRYVAELGEARAALVRAQASLKMAETDLRYTAIRAPYDGAITQRHTEAGAFVKEGQAIVTMVSHHDIEIEADVPSQRVGGLAPGTAVTFELTRGKRISATVRAVVPEENLRTRTRLVRFKPDFKVRPEALAANQSTTVYLPIGKPRNVLSVHKDALVSSRGQQTVFVVEEGRAQARQIKIGEGVGGRFEVLAGVKEGDLVVIRGNETLKDRRRVQIDGATH
jgi:RND family efflux transporter MFP subunit